MSKNKAIIVSEYLTLFTKGRKEYFSNTQGTL